MTDNSNILIFTDLDDTLFSTLRKIPSSQKGGVTLAARASAEAAAGKDSYMTSKQTVMLDWLDLSRCVPVTARGTEAYSRVALPFSGPAAIVSNGAVILDAHGNVNEEWACVVNEILAGLQEIIHGLSDTLLNIAKKLSLNIRSWAVVEPSCGAVYAVAKSNDSTNGEDLNVLLEELKNYLRLDDNGNVDDWLFHTNSNNLSVTPRGISKAAAVSYLLKNLEFEHTILTVGVGDSISDLEFMQLCDVWLTPTRSQINQLLASS